MNRLNRIAFVALACFTLGVAAVPAEADSRSDRRGGHACCGKHADKDAKRYEKAYRAGVRDGRREARRDEWSDHDWWKRDDDHPTYDRAHRRDRGHTRGWRVGERPPRNRVIVVRDHRERNYPRPPRDAYYVSIDRDVFLVAAATGIIIDVLRRD